MYTLVLDDDYCEEYTVSGGIVGENFNWKCIIDGGNLHYDPIIAINNGKALYCVRLSNADEFVNIAKEGIFKFSGEFIKFSNEMKLVAECVDKIASKLENIEIIEKEGHCFVKYNDREIILFSDIGIPLELLNEEFNLSNFFEKENVFNMCNYCGNIRENYFVDGSNSICNKCFNEINLKCARISGNNNLKNKLILKKI